MSQIKSIDLSKAKEIASGGEGKIVEHPLKKSKVIKIYHQPRKYDFAEHLKALSTLSSMFIKPGEIYYNDKNEVVGFEMDYINFNNYFLFNNLFNKGFCTSNKITDAFKISILGKLKEGVEELHSKKIIVGDLNQYNLFFSKKNEILFVDVDSYGTVSKPHGGVLLDDIRDWSTMNINEQTDSYAYDILAFWSTTYVHPFKWVAPGNIETLEQRVKTNKSILSKIPNIKIPVLYQAPIGDVLKQFLEIFSGRRYMVEFNQSYIPVNAVVTQPIYSSNLIVNELYTDVTEIYAADNFISMKRKNLWFLLETKLNKVTRLVDTIDCDTLYPSNNQYAYVKGNSLHTPSIRVNTFIQPYFYYNNGSLSVLDYADDVQYNYNLNNQLLGIDHTQTSVFAKSIVYRNTPIQNFGSKKYLNVPYNNTYKLIAAPDGVKDAYYLHDWAVFEYKIRSNVDYLFINAQSKFGILIDYLPHFAIKGDIIFIPNDGCIDVYQKGIQIMKFDVSNCTKNSKLYNTNSGIIMLENNTVYLLNTK